MRYSLCNHWEFTEQWSDAFCRGEPVGCRPVRLPHTCRELPLHYADPSDYEMVCGYRRTLSVPDAPRVFLRFDGAAHQAEIYLNGQLAGQHQGGYTGFTIEITDLVHRGTENLLAVRLDTREDPSLPPYFILDKVKCMGYTLLRKEMLHPPCIKRPYPTTSPCCTAALRISQATSCRKSD